MRGLGKRREKRSDEWRRCQRGRKSVGKTKVLRASGLGHGREGEITLLMTRRRRRRYGESRLGRNVLVVQRGVRG